jgi:parallel beta-helix repeat protein
VLITTDDVALALDHADDNLVALNTLAEITDHRFVGAVLTESSRNVWRDNEFLGTSEGLVLHSGADNSFVGNRLSGAPAPAFNPTLELDGFHVDADATGTVLRRNAVHDFGDDGIDVRATGTLIKGNSANDNGDLGIFAVPGAIDGGANTASGNGNPSRCVGVACG